LPGGEVGASEVVDADGQRWVAKWEWPAADGVLAGVRAALRIVAALRGRGARLPEYLVAEPVAEGMLVVQRMMPGFTSDEIPVSLLEDLIAHNELQAGAAQDELQAGAAQDGQGWKEYMTRSLLVGLDGYCEHRSLSTHSAATRALLSRIQASGEALEDIDLVENDAVHLDFHHRNALASTGRLTAVIDCEGYRSGDRVFDLVTLAFCLSAASCPTTAQDRLWERIRSARDGAVVDAYAAHQALRQVDWSIRHRTSDELEDWMARSRELF
jgi:hypothetical protein